MAADLRGDLLGAEDHLTLQWTGVLTAPIAWAAMLAFNYSLAKWSCGHGTAYVLQLIALAALLCAAAGALAAWRTLTLVPAGATDDGGRGADRSRFMGLLGLGSSALFGLLSIASSVPIWTLHGVCW